MTHFDCFIRIDVDDLCKPAGGFGRGKISPLEMCVSVKMIARLCDANQPVDGFESLMCLRFLIMNSKGRRVCDENIEGASAIYAVQEKSGKHAKGSKVCFSLRMLVCPIGSVTDGSAETADQKFFIARQLQV